MKGERILVLPLVVEREGAPGLEPGEPEAAARQQAARQLESAKPPPAHSPE